METPFPGMDPYLEHPSLWPDVHNSLIAALRDDIAPKIAPDYYIGLERRVYTLDLSGMVFVGRPDLSISPVADRMEREPALALAGGGAIPVEVPTLDEVEETFLEVRDVQTGRVITIIELLSPANKLYLQGREDYIAKRLKIFSTRTNLVEIDLLRAGEPMPLMGRQIASDYRILVRRGTHFQRAYLYPFSVRQTIPKFELPLLPGDEEPTVDLTRILHALYTRARFDLRLDYTQPAEPPLAKEDIAWADDLINSKSQSDN